MSFLSHIGATAYKFEVELVVVKVQLGAPSVLPLLVEWKRGSSSARTPAVGGAGGEKQSLYDFGKRALKLTSTFYRKKDRWQKKESVLTVKSVGRGGKEERVGVVEFDLAQYVDQSDAGVSESLTLPLQKYADKSGGRITFRLHTTWLRNAEINSDEEPSRSTNAVSQSRESSLNQEPAGSPGTTGLDRLDASEDSDEDDAPPPKRGGRAAAAAVEHTDSEDEEDARSRKIRFNKQPQGRTGGADASGAGPKKSNLKGGSAPAANAGAKGANGRGGKGARDDDDEDETDSDASDASPPPSKRPGASAAAAAAAAPPKRPASDEEEGEDQEEEEGGIPLFGVTLASIMSEQRDVAPELDVPLVLDVLLRGIDKLGGLALEGLFRVSPLTRAREELKQKFEQGDYRMPRDAHVAAALLKLWLGELKEPLWPEKLNGLALDLGKIEPSPSAGSAGASSPNGGNNDSEDSDSDDEYAKRKRARAAAAKKASSPEAAAISDGLRALLPRVPALHLRVLSRLLSFLSRVSSPPAVSKTKMSTQALAVVFAPNLLRLKVPDAASISLAGAGAQAARKAQDEYLLETKRAVNFVQHLANNVALVEAAARGELKSPSPTNASGAGAKGGKKAAAAFESEDSEAEINTSGSQKKPLQSFSAAAADEDSEDEDEDPRRSSARSPPAAAAAAARKQQDTDESELSDVAPPPKAAAVKSPPSAGGKGPSPSNRRATAAAGRPADDSDDSEEEATKRSELFRKKGSPGAGATSPPAASTGDSIKDALFAKRGGGSAASAAAASKKRADATDSEADSADSHDDDNDDEEDEDDAYAARQREANKKKTDAIAKEELQRREKEQQLAQEAAVVARSKNASSAKSAFGESDEDSEDDAPAPVKRPPPAGPPPPQPSPSPRTAKAALAAKGASASSSSPSNTLSAEEASKLRAQVAELQAQVSQLEEHVVELEDAAEEAGGAASAQKLEKENARLRAENAELKRSNATTETAQQQQAEQQAEQMQQLQARVAEVEEELRTSAVQLKQKDELIRRQKEQIDSLQTDLDHAREQAAAAAAAADSEATTPKGSKAELQSLRRQVRLLEELRSEHEHKEDILARMAAAAAAREADDDAAVAPTPTRRAFAESKALQDLERHVQELEASVASKDEAIRALEAQLGAAQVRSPPSRSKSSGARTNDEEQDRSPIMSPQFDRAPSFGVRDSGDGFGDINTSSSRGSSTTTTPRNGPPAGAHAPPPPPPPPASVTAATAALRKQVETLEARVEQQEQELEQREREIKKLRQGRAGGASDDEEDEFPSRSSGAPSAALSQLASALSALASVSSGDSVRGELAKAQSLLASKDARVKELSRELRRKDDEIEQFLQVKTDALDVGGEGGAGADEAEIDWASLTERQKVKKGQSLARLAKYRAAEVKSLALRVRQLDAELDDVVDGHKARKSELKKANEELALAQQQLDALKQQAQGWKDVEQQLRTVVAQLEQQGGSTSSSALSPSRGGGADASALRSLQSELESVQSELAASAAQLARLERDNARLTKEINAQRALESSGPSSGKSGDSALKKQVASLLAERDELTHELDEADAKAAEARKAAQDSKKACRAHLQELEDLKQQLREAQANGPRGGRSPATPSRIGASAGGGSLDEQQLREELSLLQLRLEEQVSDAEEKLQAERKLKQSLLTQVESLRQETESLRARSLRFDDLSVIPSHVDPKKNAKDKVQMDLIAAYEALVKRERFVEAQLKECDATLTNAKAGWMATIALMADQCTQLEAELTEVKRVAAERQAAQPAPVDQETLELLQRKLRKAESARSKLAEVAAQSDAELAKKKAELTVAHQTLIALQQENKKVKEELVRSGLALKTIADDNFELKEHLRMLHSKGKK